MELTPGIIAEKKRQVTENDTALHLGSGSLPVLATPAVVAWMEHCATCVINSQLQPHETSVGAAIDVLHIKASAVGEWITCCAELVAIEGRQLHFTIVATNANGESIATAKHTRVLVDVERFMAKLK